MLPATTTTKTSQIMLSFHLQSAIIIFTLLFTPTVATLRGLLTKIHGEPAALSDEETLGTNINDRDLETRIVGGTQASVGEYPYYTQWIYGCGASLIHDDIVITAAHCNEIATNTVHVGAFKTETISNGAVLATIAKRVVHPKYNPNTHVNDFLILKLTSPVDKVPVNLNRNSAIPTTGEDLVAVGLGTLTTGGDLPTYLQEVTVQAVAQITCNQKYSGNIDAASMICAGVPGGGKDTCQGDSGGPLVMVVNGVHTLIGITSWGEGCATAAYPGVYSRVSDQVAWIDQQICALSSRRPASCSTTSTVSPVVPGSNTKRPTATPTKAPTIVPSTNTNRPTSTPVKAPTVVPGSKTKRPSSTPVNASTMVPSANTEGPSSTPVKAPTVVSGSNIKQPTSKPPKGSKHAKAPKK